MIDRLIRFCMEQKLIVLLVAIALISWGLIAAPFNFRLGVLPSDPVPVDAIPDLGENQQIVFTDWPGRSPQDVENQVTYPLTTALQGIPGVRNVRSNSMFGFSSIYVIFEDDVEFYWSRSRILEKLNSLPAELLPPDVTPMLGPDATAMGQIFWYTLEGRTPEGSPVGGWNLEELRSIQDWQVRYALQGAQGVAEVASVGGFVREYQVDVDPGALRAFDVSLSDVMMAVESSNIDVGAATLEHNGVEYVIRGRGFITEPEDIARTAVMSRGGIPITIDQVAHVSAGPAQRRGALDKAGAEAVGGVVAARYGANPMLVIENVKGKIDEIAPSLPSKTLEDGTVSKVTIVPFYDRTALIQETLGTLRHALRDEIIVTCIVVLLMALHLRSSLLIGAMLPLSVLFSFILMKVFGVQANVVALGGIAIAIGSVTDMGIVLTENMLQHLAAADPKESRFTVIHRAASEVGSAVMTAVATTIVSFLPVFAMVGAEGKLFTPLAYTKTFALFASIIISICLLPPLAHVLLGWKAPSLPRAVRVGWKWIHIGLVVLVAGSAAFLLATTWEPLGAQRDQWQNVVTVVLVVGGLIGFFWLFELVYTKILAVCLRFKIVSMVVPVALTVFGFVVWLGYNRMLHWLPEGIHQSPAGEVLAREFPGLGREFMPTLDEGSFLYMPVAMPHAGIGESMEYLRLTDMAIQAIPEVELVVGKIGRAESPLDPAPVSMIETVIQYAPEYRQDRHGKRLNFAVDADGEFLRDEAGEPIADVDGKPYRNWRPEIRTPADIWEEIAKAAQIPGLTAAPNLAPIAARQVMLQSGMRAPMGIKVRGPNLEAIQEAGLRIEEVLKTGNIPGIRTTAVVAERIVGVPYLEIIPDRDAIARYGVAIQDVMDAVEVAIGGRAATRTVEGRERCPVRVRYMRELRDTPDELESILIDAPAVVMGGPPVQIPLRELAEVRYTRGPMSIRSEDTFLTGYVLFDKESGYAEVDVVEAARKVVSEELDAELPAGVSYSFAGTYQNQLRANRTLMLVLPLTLLLIFLIIYFQFRSAPVTMIVFLPVFTAWSGGFIFLWLWAEPWFMNFTVFDVNLREVFRMGEINLSVAVWVGFLALFGLATDDGVIQATYIRQSLDTNPTATTAQLRAAIIFAAQRRIRPCLMTSATTILAMLPLFTSTGKGAEIMIPLAIPLFGGMLVVLISIFVVPILYCAMEEAKLVFRKGTNSEPA